MALVLASYGLTNKATPTHKIYETMEYDPT
jgi:hypothetical protein